MWILFDEIYRNTFFALNFKADIADPAWREKSGHRHLENMIYIIDKETQ